MIDDHREQQAGANEEEDTKRVLLSVIRLAHDLVLSHIPDYAARRSNEYQLHAGVVPEKEEENASSEKKRG